MIEVSYPTLIEIVEFAEKEEIGRAQASKILNRRAVSRAVLQSKTVDDLKHLLFKILEDYVP